MTDKPLTIEQLRAMMANPYVDADSVNPVIRQLIASMQREAEARAELAAWKDVLITKLWMGTDEAEPIDGALCDVRYQDGTLGYARYTYDSGFVDATKDEPITHWKPAPKMAAMSDIPNEYQGDK